MLLYAKRSRRVLISGIAIFFLLGLMYSWSVFVTPLEDEFGWTRNQTSGIYTVFFTCFQLGIMFCGIITKYTSERFTAFVGLALVVSGLCLCFFTEVLIWLYVFYGAFCGLGIGICNNAWIGKIFRWFPEKKGSASGLLLLGFGIGGMACGSIASAIIYSPVGWRFTFLIFGFAILAVGGVSMISFIPAPSEVREHTPSETGAGKETGQAQSIKKRPSVSPAVMLRQGCLWTFLFWKGMSFTLCAAIAGQTAMIAYDAGAAVSTAALAIGVLSIGNGSGRILVGLLSDRIGVGKTMILLSAVLIALSLVLFLGYERSLMFMLLCSIAVLGICYGGITLTAPNYISSVFGDENFTVNNGISALTVIPFLLLNSQGISIIKTQTGSYSPFFLVMTVMSVCTITAAIATPALIRRMDARLGDSGSGRVFRR